MASSGADRPLWERKSLKVFEILSTGLDGGVRPTQIGFRGAARERRVFSETLQLRTRPGPGRDGPWKTGLASLPGLGKFPKKAIDGGKSPPYMALHRRGGFARPVCVFSIGNPVAPVIGVRKSRLFDIVGLDEGTCGRRPRSATASGCRWSVKAKPFQRSVLWSLLQGSVLHVSLHIHSICEVQERLPEMPASSSGFPPGWLSVINLRV